MALAVGSHSVSVVACGNQRFVFMKGFYLLGLFPLAVLLEIYRELHSFKMTHYTIVSSKWRKGGRSVDGRSKDERLGGKEAADDKLLFLSDLHNHVYGERNEKLLAAIRKECPTAILVGGDIPVSKIETSFQDAAKFVGDLCKICPVYYVNGNHEQRYKEDKVKYGGMYERYKKQICDAGVILLENESTYFEAGGKRMRISGLELPLDTYKKWKHSTVRVQDIADKVGDCPHGEYQILLAHNPEYVDSYLAWGADLVLCGHLHGGLVCLPGGKSLITPQFHLFPRYAGEMTRVGEQTVIVSRGLGTHTIHVRLFNPAEVIVLHLKGE